MQFFLCYYLYMEKEKLKQQIVETLEAENLYGKDLAYIINFLSTNWGIGKKDIITAFDNLSKQNKIDVKSGKIEKGTGKSDLEFDAYKRLQNAYAVMTGTIKMGSDGRYYVAPVGKSMRCQIPQDKVAKENLNKLCIISVTKTKKSWSGKIEKIIGEQTFNNKMLAILVGNHIPLAFSDEAMAQAEQILQDAQTDNFADVQDLQDLDFVAVDPKGCGDRDDAIFAKKQGDKYVAYVAVADVNHFVKVGSPLWNEAYIRAFSEYAPTFSNPMFPLKLTKEVFSLEQNKPKRALVAKIELDEKMSIVSAQFVPAVIKVKHAMTYEDLSLLREKKCRETFEGESNLVDLCYHIAQSLDDKYVKSGKITLTSAEPEFILSADGKDVVGVKNADTDFSHKVIENFMILANCAVGNFLKDNNLDGIFRVHDAIDEERKQSIKKALERFGIKIDFDATSSGVAGVVKAVAKTPFADILSGEISKNFMRAKYSVDLTEHFGLGFDADHPYVHSTSVERRFSDVVVHKIILDTLQNGQAPFSKQQLQNIVEHINEVEARASKTERQMDKCAYCHLASKMIGEKIDCKIVAITKDYLVLKDKKTPMTMDILIDSLVEPNQKIEICEEQTMLLVGEKTYKVGDDLSCVITGVDQQKFGIFAKQVAEEKCEMSC